MRSLVILDLTAKPEHKPPTGWMADATYALTKALHDLTLVYGEMVWHVVEGLNAKGYRVMLVDDIPEAPGALAYHDNDAQGPYCRIGIGTILSNRGTWDAGSLSVISVIDHEHKELCIDVDANRWANSADGTMYALETCDPVQDSSYKVTCPSGNVVTVSNFVYPDWFNPFAPAGAKFDHLGLLSKPFTIAPGGYVIKGRAHGRMGEHEMGVEFGPNVPLWQRDARARGADRLRWFR